MMSSRFVIRLLLCCILLCAPLTVDAQEASPVSEQSEGITPDTDEEGAGPSEVLVVEPEAEAAPEAIVTLPHDLSVWGMFKSADWVVKAVMIGLAVASLITWTVLLAKSIELASVRRRLNTALQAVSGARTLNDAAIKSGIGAALVEAARDELVLSSGALQANGVKERVASSLSRIEAGFARRLSSGTGLLATIGATAPFVGLFGTVWGIMNAFIGISTANTTNLAVVAPGIAEALLATALGLVAAIPAVVIYNHFARRIASLKTSLADISAAVLRLVSRDLDRGASQRS
ncbi:MAG: tonB-system energizer ExbB [Pseudomonadota bacterium]